MDPEPQRDERPHAVVTRKTLVRVFALALLASAAGIALGLILPWFPVAASTQAGPIDHLWDVLLIVSIPIFVIVATVVIMSVIKFRMRPGEENLDGPPIHGNTRLEVVWTAIPALMLLALCTYAYIVLHQIEKAPAKGATNSPEIRVEVTGQQFAWTFKYETDDQGHTIAPAMRPTALQLYLPNNQSVEFDVKSVDVLHDFWVPAFRMKIDAVPGITTHYRVTPDRLGSYPVVCAELCGLGHAFMRNTAHVMPRAAFATWLSRKARATRAGGGSAAASTPPAGSTSAAGGGSGGGAIPKATPAMLADGKAVFNANGCSGCHTLSDAGATGQVGPDLDKFLPKYTPTFIRTSIVDPNAYVEKGFPANTMPPNFGQALTKKQLNDLVAYLYTVTHK